MRAAKISAAVIAVIAMGSTPVSSLVTRGKFARGNFVACRAPDNGAISLTGAKGAFGIALVSSHRCD